jgi:hypothetical protein
MLTEYNVTQVWFSFLFVTNSSYFSVKCQPQFFKDQIQDKAGKETLEGPTIWIIDLGIVQWNSALSL